MSTMQHLTIAELDIESLTVEQAKDLRAELDFYIASNTPLSENGRKAFDAVAGVLVERFGDQESPDNVAARLGIDLGNATMAEVRPLSAYYGRRMSEGMEGASSVKVSVGPDQP
ncbi:hypothetical protein NOCA2140041 [metagenome]|uniref:Uncharacterized protein n=1 Tax=metagenome TaxID=256318 RepID=A0A2P2BWU7_9ZZZZ